MITTITYKNKPYTIDLTQPLDISIPIRNSEENVNAWYIDGPTIAPVTDKDWVGKVSEGASTNFNTITFNPHSHGTHTECVGHISSEFYSINKALTTFFFKAEVISVQPISQGDDHVITKDMIRAAITSEDNQALVIRTLPNTKDKLQKHYSHTNWPYFTEDAIIYIREKGITHLLVDLPSIDKEKDEGKLLGHKAFWNYPEAIRHDATITEFIFVPDPIEDGVYFLNLQIAAFENDATPSKPVLYKIQNL